MRTTGGSSLLHLNVWKFGTIFNTVAAATKREGVIRRKA
jgi:hypothetical protein